MNVSKQKFLIVGVSKSGRAVAEYVLNKNGAVFLFEQLHNDSIESTIKELVEKGAVRLENPKERLDEIDVVVVSPGVPINHELIVTAKEKNKRIISELEFGFLNYNGLSVAVTGTNGKTTTVTQINHVLKENGLNSDCAGNIGCPITARLEELREDSIVVSEVSSFQLETTNVYCPHISCVLNLAPDHLERHYTMDNYAFLKSKLLRNQTQSEYAILNYDDETVKAFQTVTKAKVYFISLREQVNGAYLKNGVLYCFNIPVINENELTVVGKHNVYNALFAILTCYLLGVDLESVKKGLMTFKGVRHRLELVKEMNGKKYYNDSKSTNTASAISAIKTLSTPTVLVLGGSEKGETYDDLFLQIKLSSVKHVVLTGASRFNMLDCAVKHGLKSVSLVEDFEYAIKVANVFTSVNECLLLSPACASFDSFKSYEERGNKFCEIVEELN